MSDKNEEPKIIVDEDWKSQVAREKEAAKEKKNDPADVDNSEALEMGELPPANILVFISMLGSQAMAALGLMADPRSGEVAANRPYAKHFIDMLGVLEEKTKGNLTEDESGHLRDALHQLRMVYVQTENMAAQAPEPKDPPSSIELP